jgi:hypothetical protein
LLSGLGFVVACSSDGGGSGKPDSGYVGDDAGGDGKTDAGRDSGSCRAVGPSFACGVVPQCGCEEGETCTVTKLDGTVECVVAGERPEGNACNEPTDCALGLACVQVCRPYCKVGGAGCEGAQYGACVPAVDQDNKPVPNLNVCTFKCKLDDPDACGGLPADPNAPVAGCGLGNDGKTDCGPAGRAGDGDACDDKVRCLPGYVCANAEGGASQCHQFCKVGFDACPANQTCVGFDTPLRIDDVEYGACVATE